MVFPGSTKAAVGTVYFGYRDRPILKTQLMASALLNLGGTVYYIFLPGTHYLTINSPDDADSSLNKLLVVL